MDEPIPSAPVNVEIGPGASPYSDEQWAQIKALIADLAPCVSPAHARMFNEVFTSRQDYPKELVKTLPQWARCFYDALVIARRIHRAHSRNASSGLFAAIGVQYNAGLEFQRARKKADDYTENSPKWLRNQHRQAAALVEYMYCVSRVQYLTRGHLAAHRAKEQARALEKALDRVAEPVPGLPKPQEEQPREREGNVVPFRGRRMMHPTVALAAIAMLGGMPGSRETELPQPGLR